MSKQCRGCNSVDLKVLCPCCDEILYCSERCLHNDPEKHRKTTQKPTSDLRNKMSEYQQLVAECISVKTDFLQEHIDDLDEFHYLCLIVKEQGMNMILGNTAIPFAPPVRLRHGKFIYYLALFPEVQFRGHVFFHDGEVFVQGSTCDCNVKVIQQTVKNMEENK